MNSPISRDDLGGVLRQLREVRALTQHEVAELAGTSVRTVYRAERDPAAITPPNLVAILEAIGRQSPLTVEQAQPLLAAAGLDVGALAPHALAAGEATERARAASVAGSRELTARRHQVHRLLEAAMDRPPAGQDEAAWLTTLRVLVGQLAGGEAAAMAHLRQRERHATAAAERLLVHHPPERVGGWEVTRVSGYPAGGQHEDTGQPGQPGPAAPPGSPAPRRGGAAGAG